MNTAISYGYELIICPACGKPIIGMVSLNLVLGEFHEKEVEGKGKVTGLRVVHDCMPKTIR